MFEKKKKKKKKRVYCTGPSLEASIFNFNAHASISECAWGSGDQEASMPAHAYLS